LRWLSCLTIALYMHELHLHGLSSGGNGLSCAGLLADHWALARALRFGR